MGSIGRGDIAEAIMFIQMMGICLLFLAIASTKPIEDQIRETSDFAINIIQTIKTII